MTLRTGLLVKPEIIITKIWNSAGSTVSSNLMILEAVKSYLTKPTRWKQLGRHSPSNIKRIATTPTINQNQPFRRILENLTRNETSISLRKSRLNMSYEWRKVSNNRYTTTILEYSFCIKNRFSI
jgi:hypothetical protein